MCINNDTCSGTSRGNKQTHIHTYWRWRWRRRTEDGGRAEVYSSFPPPFPPKHLILKRVSRTAYRMLLVV